MNNIKIFALIIGIAFFMSCLPGSTVVTQPTATQKTVAVEVGSLDYYPDYANFVTMLGEWGFNVELLYNNNETYDLTGVDILILPMMNENLSTANEAAVVTWWETGNKAMWVAGDSDYNGAGGYGAMAAHRPNRILEAVDAHMFLEQTAIESEWNDITVGAIGYRVAGGVYATEGDALKLVSNLPTNKTIFHGPTCVIAKNSTDSYVDFEHASVTADIAWAVKAINNTKYQSWAKNATNPVAPYRVHGFYEYNDYVLMGLEKFTNGNKLVVTGENSFSMYKFMFSIPLEKTNTAYGSTFVIVYNTLMYFAARTCDSDDPIVYDLEITIQNATLGTCLFTWKLWDGWFNATVTPSGVTGVIFKINGTLKEVLQRTDLTTDVMAKSFTIKVNITEAELNATTFDIIPIDWAGNLGTFDSDFVIPPPPTSTISSTPTTTEEKPTPGFEVPTLLMGIAVIALISRRKN